TQTNVVVGTPNYMAPEQTVGGGTIDARTDVYAVGVVLFEMIAGERPFQADDTLALLGMHRAAPIPKLADRVERTIVLPVGLQDVIETAMAKDPDDRYQSAIELAAAIDGMAGARVAPDGVTVSPSARRSDIHRIESTIVDVNARNTSDKSNNKSAAARRSGSRAGIVLALMVLAGGAGAAWYIQQRDDRGARHDDEPDPAAGISTASGADVLATGPVPASDARPTDPLPTGIWNGSGAGVASSDAAVDAAEVGTGSAEPVGLGSAVDPNAGSGSADPNQNAVGSAGGIGSGDGSGEAGQSDGEIEMTLDPVAATNPAPEDPTKPEVDDEAEDAPKSTADVEKRTPVAPAKATTIREAVKLIQEGKHDLALASLRAIWKKTPNSAYVPFLLGNLYFDQRWWSVAMDHYRAAITKNAGYKRNATLNRNIIRMLGSMRTNKRAQVFLRRTIGRASVPYLRHAAANEKNPHVKKWAAYMVKQIR
nr:hypothetical protein [Myxococcota bacterium]